MLIALPISGWLVASAEGAPVDLFGFTTLPMASVGEAGEERFEEMHEVLGNVLIALVAPHVIGALKHHFVDRDGVMRRILPGRPAQSR